MKTLSAREYLGQLQELDTNINQDLERLDDMKTNACSTGAIDYSAERVQTSPSGDSLCKAVTNYVAFNDEINAEIDRFCDAKNLIIKQIRGLHNNYFNQIYKFKEGVNEIKINNNGFKDKLIHLVYGILYDVYNHSADKALDDLSMDLIKGMIANMRFWGDSLYMCFQYILDNNYLDDEQKMFYLRILSNSLDSTENKIIYFYGLFCKYYNIAEELNKNGILYKDRVIEQFSIDSTLDSLRNNMDVERNVWLQNWQPTQKNTM